MLKNWKPAAWAAVSLISVLAFTACSKSEDPGTTPPQNEGTPVVEKKAEPVELTIYTPHSDTEEAFNASMGNRLRAKFPNYTIKFLNGATGGSIANAVLNNVQFDLYYATPGLVEEAAFVHGFEYDMSAMIKKHNVDLSGYHPAFKELFGPAYGGKIYFLPIQANANVFYYNKDAFDKIGLAYPKDNMTWADLIATSKRLTRLEEGVQYIGLKPGMLRQASIPYIKIGPGGTATTTINTDERWKMLFQNIIGPLASVAEPIVMKEAVAGWNEFYQGTLAMIGAVPGSMVSIQKELEAVNFDLVAYPKPEGGFPGFQPVITNMMISKISKNKDAAMEVLKYLISAEAQTGMAKAGIGPVLNDPAVQKSLGADSVFKKQNWQAAFANEWGPVTYHGVLAKGVYDIMNKYSKEVINDGKRDYNTLLRQAEEEAVKKIEELKKTIKVEGAY